MLNFGNKEFRNLQEQVLKNAQDIETLKGREDLQIVIVNELPEVGNPNYIYLVAKDDGESPDVYDEYIWLEDEERYEKIGGVSIDLTNYVTTDTEQKITGAKTFETTEAYTYPIKIKTSAAGEGIEFENQYTTGSLRLSGYTFQFNYSVSAAGIQPYGANRDLGTSENYWRDLYLSGKAYVSTEVNTPKINASAHIHIGNGAYYLFIDADSLRPNNNGLKDIGSNSAFWRNIYFTGSLMDGANTVSVANIASKVTSTFISGSFDANGESTIDTEQAGTPEGLFIFTYGNCQCFLRLTATMIQNADTAPIRVACPMIYNSGTVNGWLNITKSGYILILKITDGTNHVDSGYSWTLTKTNLI